MLHPSQATATLQFHYSQLKNWAGRHNSTNLLLLISCRVMLCQLVIFHPFQMQFVPWEYCSFQKLHLLSWHFLYVYHVSFCCHTTCQSFSNFPTCSDSIGKSVHLFPHSQYMSGASCQLSISTFDSFT